MRSPCCLLQTSADLPAGSEWLGPVEKEHLAALKNPKRKSEWLLGRWTAKVALQRANLAEIDSRNPAELEIRAQENGAPRAFQRGKELAVAVSLSHRAGAALCSVAGGGRVGCDLEWLEPRSPAFIRDYFTPRERLWIESAESRGGIDLRSNSLWSAKESLLKLVGIGLRVDTLGLEVEARTEPGDGAWNQFLTGWRGEGLFLVGWWTRIDRWIATLVTDPECRCPQPLVPAEEEG